MIFIVVIVMIKVYNSSKCLLLLITNSYLCIQLHTINNHETRMDVYAWDLPRTHHMSKKTSCNKIAGTPKRFLLPPPLDPRPIIWSLARGWRYDYKPGDRNRTCSHSSYMRPLIIILSEWFSRVELPFLPRDLDKYCGLSSRQIQFSRIICAL